MTGSAINVSGKNILLGMPLAEGGRGVFPADEVHQTFALATDGGPSGAVIAYADSGIVERSDWSPILGTVKLSPGKKYFLAQQQIGVARSATGLRIAIQSVAPVVSNIWPLTNPPAKSLGKKNDFALDQNTLAFYLRAESGWQLLGYLVKTLNAGFAPITIYNNGNGWSFTPSS